MSMRSALTLVLIGLLLVGCNGRINPEPEATGAMVQVRLTMGYRPDIQFAPLYVSDKKGYFHDAGIQIEFYHIPETEAVQLVGANELRFAVVSGEQVLLARAQGLPVVYVMAWWQDYPVAVVAPAASGINIPSDLIGKRVGIPGLYGASYIGYRALLSAAGVPEESITLDSIGYNQVEALYQGQEDAVVVYANNEPLQLEAQGVSVEIIRVADYVHLTSNGLITNQTVIAENPDLISRMVEAILNGLNDTISDPIQAYEISKLYVEGLEQADETVLRGVLNASIEFWKADRMGYSDPVSWENMQLVLLEMGLLKDALDLTQAFTNEFLP